MTIELGGQSIQLRPSGAALVDNALVVADLHLGKERAFRQQGIAVPDGPSHDTLIRLADEIVDSRVRRVIFLGDLFHHERAIAGSTFKALDAWFRDRPTLEAVLVLGNHDRIPVELRDAIATTPSLSIGRLELHHHPIDTAIPHLAGHLHPGFRIESGHEGVRLPCFWRRDNRLILPAFSDFTGSMTIEPAPGDEIFVPLGNGVQRLTIS